jgi:N-acetylglucosamine malate deacetylase 1
MNTLVVAPHPDDETIGCGGRVVLATAAGETVGAVFLTSGELGLEDLAVDRARAVREAEAEEAAQILGIASLTFLRQPDWFLSGAWAQAATALHHLLRREPPNRLLIPHIDEWHPDHAATAAIARMVLRNVQETIDVQTYEVWTPMTAFDDVEDISVVMPTKLAAVRAYRSQVEKFRYDEAVEGLNRFRGALTGRCRYAEAYGQLEATDQPAGTPRASAGESAIGFQKL